MQAFSGGVLLAVVDALGHGAEASATARAAIDALARHAHEPPGYLMRQCHEALVRTRGAVVSLASLDVAGATVNWLGVGNVEGTILPAGATGAQSRAVLVPAAGIVGRDLPRVRAELIRIEVGDTLVLATDGIRSGFAETFELTGPPQQVADAVLARFGKGTDDALVLVARFVGDGLAPP